MGERLLPEQCELLEAKDVDGTVEDQPVATRARHERGAGHLLGGPAGARDEPLPQVEDVSLERGDTAARRFVTPELTHERAGGHRLASVEDQSRENAPQLRGARRQIMLVQMRRERPENEIVHCVLPPVLPRTQLRC